MTARLSFMVLGLVAAVAVTAAAQPGVGGRGGRGPFGPRGGPGGGEPPFARALQLTEDQREALRGLREKEGAQMKALAEQLRPIRERMREALNSGAPDASSVGQLAIEAHGIRQNMQQIRMSFHEQFVALLTDEQKQRLETLESMMGPGRRFGGPGPGVGGPGPGGPGAGEPSGARRRGQRN